MSILVVYAMRRLDEPRDRAGLAPSYPSSGNVEGQTATAHFPRDKGVAEHNFGIIQPNVMVKWRFEILNPTPNRWTFKRTTTGCSCVRPVNSGPCIEPGGTGWIDVTYKAPAKEVDDSRAIDVAFKEPDAPQIRLVTRATIRQQLYADPASIVHSGVGPDDRLLADLHIHNYSATKWPRLLVEASEQWISIDLRPELKALRENDRAPLQAWRIAVAIAPGKLRPGMHRAVIRAIGGPHQRDIPVEIDVLPPVAAIPAQIFFGKLSPGQVVERQITLAFNQTAAPLDPTMIHMGHTLGKDFEVTIKKGQSPRYYYLLAKFHPTLATESFRGVLHVASGGHGLDIPVIAARAVGKKTNRPSDFD